MKYKYFVAICLLSLVALSMAAPDAYPRGCIWVVGKCQEECPEGTHGYAVGCSQKLPEATCDQPNPVKEEAIICDFSACYCDPPTVRNTVTKQCVPLDQCPEKE